MATFKTIESNSFEVEWYNTGKELSRIDCYDWTEEAEGIDQFGNAWVGYAIMSIDEIVDIEDAVILE